MSYTKREWATGNVVGAVDLNRIENGIADIDVDEIRGWGVQNTQLFSETVTTVDTEFDTRADLTYSLPITTSVLIVVFNGTSYTCPKIEAYGLSFYGGFDANIGAPDFTTFPFFIMSDPTGVNTLVTETAGTYTVAASGEGIVVSDNFNTAVNQCVNIDTSTLPMLCVSGTTKKMEMAEAVTNGRMLYFYYTQDYNDKMCIIANIYVTPMTLIPSDARVTATFDSDEDETFIVTVS